MHFKTMRRTQRAQAVDRSLTPVAAGEVGTDDQSLRSQRTDQRVADEAFHRLCATRLVEGQDETGIDKPAGGQQTKAVVHGAQQRGRRPRAYYAAWMRVKRQHKGRQAMPFAQRAKPCQDLPMARVQAVEHADGHYMS